MGHLATQRKKILAKTFHRSNYGAHNPFLYYVKGVPGVNHW